MCGIGGFSRNPDSTGIRAPRRMVKALTYALRDRGKDAAGVAWWDKRKNWPYSWKQGGDPWDVLPFLDEKAVGMQTAICHTRAGTGGPAKDNANNHPVSAPGILLAHNGVLYNDRELLKKLGVDMTKVPAVDSAAIANLLAFGQEVFGIEHPADLLSKIEGDASLAWYDVERSNTLFLARVIGRPLWIAETIHGDLIFASTDQHIEVAADLCDVALKDVKSVPEGTMLTVLDGKVIEERTFEKPKEKVYTTYSHTIPAKTTTTFTSGGRTTTIPAAAPQLKVVTKPDPKGSDVHGEDCYCADCVQEWNDSWEAKDRARKQAELEEAFGGSGHGWERSGDDLSDEITSLVERTKAILSRPKPDLHEQVADWRKR